MSETPSTFEQFLQEGEQLAKDAARAEAEFDRQRRRVDPLGYVPPGGTFPFLDDQFGVAHDAYSAAHRAYIQWWPGRGVLNQQQIDRIQHARIATNTSNILRPTQLDGSAGFEKAEGVLP